MKIINDEILEKIKQAKELNWTNDTFAGIIFRNQCSNFILEGVLYNVFEEAEIVWEDYTIDYYDESIEILGCGNFVPSQEQLQVIWDLGFSRVWFHPKDSKIKEIEKLYVKSKIK